MKTPKQSNKFMFYFLIYMGFLPFIITGVMLILNLNGIIDDALWDNIGIKISLYGELLTMLPPVILLMAVKNIPLGELVPFKHLSVKNAAAVIIMTLLFMPTMTLFSNVANFFIENDVNEEIANLAFNLNAWESIFCFAVLPAVLEELVFRGVIMTGYKRLGMLKAAAAAGLFFGMMHLNAFQLTYTVIGGIVFGIFVYCTNSIYASMLGHFVLNGIQIVLQVLYFSIADPEEVRESLNYVMTFQEKIDSLVFSAALTVFTLPFFVLLIRRFIRKNKNNMLEYKYGFSDESLNIAIADEDFSGKIIDKFFVLSILLYLAEMAVQSYLYQ